MHDRMIGYLTPPCVLPLSIALTRGFNIKIGKNQQQFRLNPPKLPLHAHFTLGTDFDAKIGVRQQLDSTPSEFALHAHFRAEGKHVKDTYTMF